MTFVISSSGRPNAFFAPESLYAVRRMDAKVLMIYPPSLPRRDAEPVFLFVYLHLVKTRLLQIRL